MRNTARVLAVVAVLSGAGTAGVLLLRDDAGQQRTDTTKGVAKAVTAAAVPELEAAERTTAHASFDPAAKDAAGRLVLSALRVASPALRGDRAARDGRVLLEELRGLAARPLRGSALMDLRVRLDRLVRERPELAPAIARAFLELEDRETLFVLSRALVVQAQDSVVRDALLEGARPGQLAARREVALLALSGRADAEAVALARAAFAETQTPAAVRAAAAYGLSRDWESLAPAEGAAALGIARGLAVAPGEDERVRTESLHLLAHVRETGGARAADQTPDRQLALTALRETRAQDPLVLAAARLALLSGEDRSHVAALLAERGGDPNAPCALAAMSLRGKGRNDE